MVIEQWRNPPLANSGICIGFLIEGEHSIEIVRLGNG